MAKMPKAVRDGVKRFRVAYALTEGDRDASKLSDEEIILAVLGSAVDVMLHKVTHGTGHASRDVGHA